VSPLWGVGSGNYITAFNLYRPVSYNSTDLWQVRFTTASNFLFTMVTEVGFAGLIALVALIFALYKNLTEVRFGNLEEISVVAFVAMLAFLPASPVLIFPLFTLLAINSKSENRKFEIEIPTRVPSAIVGAFLIILIAVFDVYAYKYATAEATFKVALDSLAKNDASLTYQTMQKAINQNPYVDRYHASLAQVDMAIASSLASKKDITDTDRQTITQLVQGAIAEGKNTVTLNAQRSGNWEVLAQIYRSIMPFAQGADQFAVQTFTQAVSLDPTNPNLRISLGGVYFSLKKYDEAIDSFKLAILAKPDLANAHYNLAITYREKKDYDNAISEMNSVLSLVAKDSQDYALAQSTLDELKKNKPAGNSENLTAPQTLEKTNVKPPIELPQDSTPPSGQ
jgi:tetratricopeptide (TPR) repeat protein